MTCMIAMAMHVELDQKLLQTNIRFRWHLERITWGQSDKRVSSMYRGLLLIKPSFDPSHMYSALRIH